MREGEERMMEGGRIEGEMEKGKERGEDKYVQSPLLPSHKIELQWMDM